jgi:hypothetical protein
MADDTSPTGGMRGGTGRIAEGTKRRRPRGGHARDAKAADPRDAEIARLREDVARLTAALAVHREAVLAAEWQQGGGVKLCGDDLVCGAMIWERKGVEMRDEHIPDCRIGRALADPDGTAALEWVRGLEARAEKAERRLAHSDEWYQQRFARLRAWLLQEIEPTLPDAADHYFAIVANGKATPYESGDVVGDVVSQAIRERDEARHIACATPGCWMRKEPKPDQPPSVVTTTEPARQAGEVELADFERFVLTLASGENP